MFLLAFHIVAVALIVVMVWAVAYNHGVRSGERRLRRRLGLDDHAAPMAGPDPPRDGPAP